MKRLFVIEAPGKVRTLQAILERLGHDARIQATRGHLFQMPEKLDNVGIDRGLREFERKPRDLSVIDWLRKEAALSEEVYIATDADAEGDVIAWDVAETIRDLHPEPMRVRLKGMDDDSVREALVEATPLKKADAIPGRTRAIIDRLIGVGFSANGVAVGRVGTALLGLVQRDMPNVRQVKLAAPAKDGGRPWVADGEIGGSLTLEVANRLVRLDLPALEVKASIDAVGKPDHTGDIMVRAGDKLDMSPAEVSKSMQRLYEGGRLSYPRSGSRGLSPSVALKMAAVLRKAGYTADGKAIAGKPEGGAHDAPYPIGPVDPGKDPEKLGHDEGVRTLISRGMVKSAQHRKEEIPLLPELVQFLVRNGFSQDVAAAVGKLPWRREIGPRYPGQESWPESEIVVRRADTVLLERAVRNNLGRPSTWANHVENFMQRGLVDDDMRLTQKGRDWIAASPKELLDPRISAAIEAACEKHTAEMLEHPDREPWELNAERIIKALPPAIKAVVDGLVMHEVPRPKIDPVVAYGSAPDVLAEAEARRAAAPVYAPRAAD